MPASAEGTCGRKNKGTELKLPVPSFAPSAPFSLQGPRFPTISGRRSVKNMLAFSAQGQGHQETQLPPGFQPNTVFGQLKDMAFLQDHFVLGFNQLGKGFPGGSLVKNLPANAGGAGSILGSGRFPGEENGKPLQYSCLGNSTIRGAWQAAVHGVTKESDTT